MTRRGKSGVYCLLTVLFGGLLRGQSESAAASGRVTDPSESPIPDAKISAVELNTNSRHETATNRLGIYYFVNLPSGSYRFEVEKYGFKTLVESNVALHSQDERQIDFAMALGAATEILTVKGSALGAGTGVGALSTVVDHRFVEELPLNGRSFQNLLQLAPGVVTAASSYYDQGQFNVNGQRGDANYFTIDGVSANFGVSSGPLGQSAGGVLPALTAGGGFNSLVSIEALQEFRIQTSSFSAEYGRMPGAHVEFSTRSGTNQFHGTVLEFFRNDKLDANDWFADQQAKPKPAERQNDLGGVLGGPLVKDRTFFFVSYEGTRLRQPGLAVAGVPDLALRNSAPAALQPILAAYPIPNGAELGGSLAQFSTPLSSATNYDAGSARIDYSMGRLSLFGRFQYAPSSTVGYPGAPLAPSNVEPIQFTTLTATAGTNWAIGPHLDNEFRFNVSQSRNDSSFKIEPLGGAVPFRLPQVLPPFADPQTSGFTFVCCSLGSELILGANAANRERQFNVVDNVSYVRGSHQLKFGVDDRRLAPTFGRRSYENQYLFPTAASVVNNAPSLVSVNSAGGASGLQVSVRNLSLYAQDSWRVSRRLTLSYGVRWEDNPPPSVANRAAPWVVDQVQNLAATQLVASGAPLRRATRLNFAPRFGFAEQLRDGAGWATALRGGAGIFYDVGVGQLGDVFALNSQYYGQTVYSNSATFPLSEAQQGVPALAGPTPPISQAAVFDPHLRLPYTVEWNLSVEQHLGSAQVLTASYAGAAGRRLLLQTYYSKPNPVFNALEVTNNGATSDYDALQLQFRRELTGGLQALVSYTWSHSIDTASSDSYVLSSSPGRASSNFDIRHMVSGALTYNIPDPRGPEWVRAAVRDWSIASTNVARTATPITVISASTFLGTSYTGVLAEVNPGVALYSKDSNVGGGKRINGAAFSAPPPGQSGNAQRNLLRGFALWQSDVAVSRRFRISDPVSLQFRTEFFNIANHPNFANPNGTLSNPFFGISTSMLGRSLGSGGATGGFSPLYQLGGPRSVQFALKLQF